MAVIPWADRLRRKLEVDTERIQSAQIVAAAIIDRKKAMGKLGALAQKIRDSKAALEMQADAVAADVEKLVSVEAPEAMKNAQAVVAGMRQDVADLDSDIRQLSNLPPAE